ncbi:hypothetical protein BJ912DRAFT_989020, partial [Pholiota molesta]
GATRGIGSLAIIYAGARDPANGASQLIQLADKYPGRIEIVKYLAADEESNDAIATVIGGKHGRVDTVIANAAIPCMGKVHDTPSDKFSEVFSINVLGPIVLFQSFRDLLKASPHPRFVPISSLGGSLALITSGTIDTAPYGTSKAALNWVTRKIHYEEDWLTTEVVFTGKNVAFEENFRNTMRTPDVAAGMIVDILLASTREKDGGEFHAVEGGRHPW